MDKVRKNGGLSLLFALALLSPIATLAQTTVTKDVREFELIAVDGNHLVVRDQNGTRELTVAPEFRFTVDGKSMAASDLKAGMKGTATVTTTTIERPVYVTTVKMGTVISQTGRSLLVKEDNGEFHRFTQTEAEARGVRWYMDGKPIQISDMKKGDRLSATIVTEGPPEILTVKEVDAYLAAEVAAASTAEVETTPEAAPEAATPEPQAATEEAAPEAAAADTTSPLETLPKPYTKNPFFWLFVVIVVVALIWILARRRVKKPLQH